MTTDWGKVAGGAAEQTDKELADGLEKLANKDITGLFPDPADKAKVDGLIAKIKANTAYNERLAAFKAVAATLGGDALKTLKGAMLALVVCLFWGYGHAQAQEGVPVGTAIAASPAQETLVSESAPLFNFGDFFHSMRAGYAIDQHGKSTAIWYTAVYDFHNTAGVSMITFNVGYESQLKRPSTMIGLRLDNMVPLLWSGKWGHAHVTTAKLPTLEILAPWISLWPKSIDNLWNLDIRYGAGLAVGF